jgi:hypothetical protein
VLLSIATCATGAQIRDPIFGIAYDPNTVHFEVAPAAISRACPDLRTPASKGDLRVYAHFRNGNTDYYIVQGTFDDFGTAVAIRGSQCTEVDSDRFLVEGVSTLTGEREGISVADNQRIMDGIASDILVRYSKALGGKGHLLKAVENSYDGMPPVLRRSLERYKATP